MLHELLLALSGHHGAIFVRNEFGEIQVQKELPFIHPTEEALLNRVCLLATHYTRFQEFIRQYGHSPIKDDCSGLHGIYIGAFCAGLDLILNPYRSSLLELEHQLLEDPHLTAAHIQTSLEQYQLLFPALSGIIDQIIQHKAHGCQILELLHKASVCGIPVVKNAFKQVLHVCHAALYKQITAWMLHGMLLDHYAEFFIHLPPDGTSTQPTSAPSGADDDELGLGGMTSTQLQNILKLTDDVQNRKSHIRYSLNVDMLPSYIPMITAEKVLFVGESVQMFERDKKGIKTKHQGSVLQQRADEFAKELLALSKREEFSLSLFDTTIDKIRIYVAEQLWTMVVEDADLVSQVRIMKDFYLLGRGELYLAFIDTAQGLLRLPPTATTQHDVNIAFQHAARNVLLEDEKLLQMFSLTITPTKSAVKDGQQSKKPSESSTSENGWNTLGLACSVDWPLYILFTPNVLERYNAMFRFLLYVKRVQNELQQCWATQMHRCHLGAKVTNSSHWWLRNHMAFLVDNLQYYLQVDVIETQISIFVEKIHSTRDFEVIRFAHENFLLALLSHSFLLMKPIAHCLNEILELCHLFCVLISQTEGALGEREIEHLDNITKKFQRQTNLLFKILSSVRSHQSSPQLAQLLLRIDFNKYFTLAGGQLGSPEVAVKPESAPLTRRN